MANWVAGDVALEVLLTGKPLADHTDEIRTILDAAPFPLLISRVSDGTVLYANDNLGAYVNVTADELIGQKTPDFERPGTSLTK